MINYLFQNHLRAPRSRAKPVNIKFLIKRICSEWTGRGASRGGGWEGEGGWYDEKEWRVCWVMKEGHAIMEEELDEGEVVISIRDRNRGGRRRSQREKLCHTRRLCGDHHTYSIWSAHWSRCERECNAPVLEDPHIGGWLALHCITIHSAEPPECLFSGIYPVRIRNSRKRKWDMRNSIMQDDGAWQKKGLYRIIWLSLIQTGSFLFI